MGSPYEKKDMVINHISLEIIDWTHDVYSLSDSSWCFCA